MDPWRDCGDQLRTIYRQQHTASGAPHTAYMAALAEYERRHPEARVFESMGAVKDALSGERNVGVVDCG